MLEPITPERLLETGMFLDNKYLIYYCNLINENIWRKRKHGDTSLQLHHVIPNQYYEMNGLKPQANAANRVYLLSRDHILAHIYLGMCAATHSAAVTNKTAIKRAIRDSKLELDPVDADGGIASLLQAIIDGSDVSDMADFLNLIEDLDEYKYLMELRVIYSDERNQRLSMLKKGVPHSEEWNRNHSLAMTPEKRAQISNSLKEYKKLHPDSDETRWKKSKCKIGKPRPESYKKHMSEIHSGEKNPAYGVKWTEDRRERTIKSRKATEARKKAWKLIEMARANMKADEELKKELEKDDKDK